MNLSSTTPTVRACGRIITEQRFDRGRGFALHCVYRGTAFILGSQSETEAFAYLDQLEDNGWTHVDCYRRGHPDPLDFIAHCRSNGWTFEAQTHIEVLKDGRNFFCGNVREYSAAFRYLVLDSTLLAAIRDAMPELAELAVAAE